MAFASTGETIAATCADGTVLLLAADTGTVVQRLHLHSPPARSVAFSPSGDMLATAGGDGEHGMIFLCDSLTGKVLRNLVWRQGYPLTLAFCPPAGKRLAVAGSEGDIRILDRATLQEVLTLRGHSGPVQSVCFSDDGTILASAGADGAVRLWNGTPTDNGTDR